MNSGSNYSSVIPAQAGIQLKISWFPASAWTISGFPQLHAGMTVLVLRMEIEKYNFKGIGVFTSDSRHLKPFFFLRHTPCYLGGRKKLLRNEDGRFRPQP
jgi:hypothetical protein